MVFAAQKDCVLCKECSHSRCSFTLQIIDLLQCPFSSYFLFQWNIFGKFLFCSLMRRIPLMFLRFKKKKKKLSQTEMTVNLASSSKSQNTRTSSALFTAALQFALFCIRSETELANFKNKRVWFSNGLMFGERCTKIRSLKTSIFFFNIYIKTWRAWIIRASLLTVHQEGSSSFLTCRLTGPQCHSCYLLDDGQTPAPTSGCSWQQQCL